MKGIFQDGIGDVSSKRIQSFICLIAAIVLAFTVKEVDSVIAFISASLLFQGVSALSERVK